MDGSLKGSSKRQVQKSVWRGEARLCVRSLSLRSPMGGEKQRKKTSVKQGCSTPAKPETLCRKASMSECKEPQGGKSNRRRPLQNRAATRTSKAEDTALVGARTPQAECARDGSQSSLVWTASKGGVVHSMCKMAARVAWHGQRARVGWCACDCRACARWRTEEPGMDSELETIGVLVNESDGNACGGDRSMRPEHAIIRSSPQVSALIIKGGRCFEEARIQDRNSCT
eukprot:scaffold15580_cov20-Tisochrysis_lutea.AAC.1